MIDRIEALIKKATPGPWPIATQEFYGDRPEDAAFIAHARQLLPLMLEVVKLSPKCRLHSDFPVRSSCMADALPKEQWCDLCLVREHLYAYCAEHLLEAEVREIEHE